MNRISDSENRLWRFICKAFDLFGLSCMWLLSSMLIITVGPASIACYDAAAHCLRDGEPNLAGRFFRTLKRELVPGILITLVWGTAFFVLWTGLRIAAQMGQGVITAAYCISLLVPLGVLCWLIPIQSRFVYRFGQLHRTALSFALAHLPQTIAILALALVTAALCLACPFFVVILPGTLVYFQSFLIEKVFKKYMPPEEEETE